MGIEQIIKLIDAGYSKDEIAALLSAEASPAAPEEQAAAADPVPAEVKKADPKADSKIDEAIYKLEKLSENMAKIAIMNSQQPPKEDVHDYLARIIDPTYKKEDK